MEYHVKSFKGNTVYKKTVLPDTETRFKSYNAYLKNTEKEALSDITTVNINNANIEIYHGSKDIIKNPYFGGGSRDNDYGRGFYCVSGSNLELAKEWACSEYNDTSAGYVNKYSFNISGLSFLNLNDFDVIYWIALTSHYRKINIASKVKNLLEKHYLADISDVDFIIGCRCDDTYIRIVTAFIKGNCSAEAIAGAIKLGYLKNQIVIKSENAFKRLKFTGYEKVSDFSLFRKKFQERKNNDDRGFSECRKMYRSGTYIEDYKHMKGLLT